MYGTIVVPVDGSPFAERAITPAVELVVAEHGRLLLLSVAHTEETFAYLHNLARTPAVEPTVVTNEDDEPALAIAALASPDTLVSMATHGRTGVRRAVLGSVTEQVLRAAAEPVLLSGPGAEGSPPIVGGLMLVCLDGSDRAEAILPHVSAWAKAYQMEIWLTSVMSPDTADVPREADGDVLESGYLARTAHDLGSRGLPVEWDVLHGPDPGRRLVDAASRLRASMIAMTTHGRTGLRRAVLGSVAMDVVHDARCPVLVARSV